MRWAQRVLITTLAWFSITVCSHRVIFSRTYLSARYEQLPALKRKVTIHSVRQSNFWSQAFMQSSITTRTSKRKAWSCNLTKKNATCVTRRRLPSPHFSTISNLRAGSPSMILSALSMVVWVAHSKNMKAITIEICARKDKYLMAKRVIRTTMTTRNTVRAYYQCVTSKQLPRIPTWQSS